MKSDEKLVIQIEKNETLGDFIQKCRQQYGWTQEELGVAHRNYKGTCGSY